MGALRDEIHLVTLDGRNPLAEYYRAAIASFEGLVGRVDDAVVEAFETLELAPDGSLLADPELPRPAATWTYLVHDDVFGGNLFLGLSTRASLGFAAVIALWPLLLAWGIYLRWKRRRSAGDDP